MYQLKPVKAIGLATLITLTGATLSACEWDNSEDYAKDTAEEPGEDTNPDDGTGTPQPDPNLTPLLSGTVTTTGPIANARICIDDDRSGTCDDDELQTVSNDSGEWVISGDIGTTVDSKARILATHNDSEATLAESGEATTWKFYLATRAPALGENTDGIAIHPLSTVADADQASSPLITGRKAEQNVAGLIGSTTEALNSYVARPSGSTTAELAEYERIDRIAKAAHELALTIDLAIPDTERDNLSENELNERIFAQVSQALPAITQDVNKSMIESPDDDSFNPGDIIEQPDYDDWTQPPSTEPPTAGETELKERVSKAENTSPFFEKSGFEVFPIENAQLLDFQFGVNTRRSHKLYYEARQRTISAASANSSEMVTQIAVPRHTDRKGDYSTIFQVISEYYCQTTGFDCDELRQRPRNVNALVWNGMNFSEENAQFGHRGKQSIIVEGELGDLVASSQSNGFSSRISLRQFSLGGLNGREALNDLLGTNIPPSGDWSFSNAAKAYSYYETLASEVILSTWPKGESVTDMFGTTERWCLTPGSPDPTTTISCNLVYGEVSRWSGMPARTFEDILYSPANINATYSGSLEDGMPVDALLLNGPTPDIYVARLFGNDNDEEGTIVIDRKTASGWKTLSIRGSWEKTATPFPRIMLSLPAGLAYADAQTGFKLGQAFLFEKQGYLRHGWSIPDETNLDTLFNREPVKYLFNRQAFDEMVDAMTNNRQLSEHPHFSYLVDRGYWY